MSKEEKLNEKYPFQFYTFSNISMLEQNGFNFDDYSFNLQHEHELYIGNINGLICRHDMGYPLRMLKYLKQEPDTMVKRKLTFLLPENYRENIGNLKGLRENVIKVFDLPCFNDQINILTYKVDNSNIMEKIEELKNMPKFDVAIMNPPYEKSLHLKILEKVIPIANKVVNISPIRWLQDPLAKYKKNSDYHRYENSITKKIEDLLLISGEYATLSFGADFVSDLAITVIGNGGFDYKHFNSNFIIDKILTKKCDTLFKHIDINKDNGWRCRVAEMKPIPNNINTTTIGYKSMRYYVTHAILSWIYNNGYQNNKHWSENTLSNGTGRKTFSTSDILPQSIKFNDERCAINFENSTKTKFYCYLMYIMKIDSHTPFKYLPFMHSYQHPWANQRFCNYFGITGFISDTEAVPGSEWEEILNTMKDFK